MRDMPLFAAMYPLQQGVLRAAREYVNDLSGCLRSEMCLEGVRTGEVRGGDIGRGWQLGRCTIRRVNHVDNDGEAWPLGLPEVRPALEAAARPGPIHYEVAASFYINKVDFEVTYEFEDSPTTWVYIYGEVDVVSLENPRSQSHAAEIMTFLVGKVGPITFGGEVSSPGAHDVDMLRKATTPILRHCIFNTMVHRVKPVLAKVLKTIPFPTFVNEDE
ncbi:hypothetical protein MRX96_022433 [Rhipicephalus microplus]